MLSGCASPEVRFSRHHDLLTSFGLMYVFTLCRRLARGGHVTGRELGRVVLLEVFLAPPCSSWVWMSRGSTRRCRLRVRGPKRIKSVRMQNKLVRRLCYVLLVCLFHVLVLEDIVKISLYKRSGRL